MVSIWPDERHLDLRGARLALRVAVWPGGWRFDFRGHCFGLKDHHFGLRGSQSCMESVTLAVGVPVWLRAQEIGLVDTVLI